MARRKRRKFSKEFKDKAVNIVKETGASMCSVAKDLDLAESVLRNWVQNKEAEEQGKTRGGLTLREREELNKLRRENKLLKMEREILKKATAFFAKENRNASSSS
jgi:transposase